MSLLNAVDKSLAMNVKHRICDLMSLISEKDYLPPCQSFSSRPAMRVLPNHRHDPPGLFPYFRRGKFDPLTAVRKVCTKVIDKVRFPMNNSLLFVIIYSEFRVYQEVSPIWLASPEGKKPHHDVQSDEGRCTQE